MKHQESLWPNIQTFTLCVFTALDLPFFPFVQTHGLGNLAWLVIFLYFQNMLCPAPAGLWKPSELFLLGFCWQVPLSYLCRAPDDTRAVLLDVISLGFPNSSALTTFPDENSLISNVLSLAVSSLLGPFSLWRYLCFPNRIDVISHGLTPPFKQ